MVTPTAGINAVVATGGVPVEVVASVPNGGYIVNPVDNAGEGVTPEVLYVDPVAPPGLVANGTTVAIQPGQKYDLIPGQQTPVYANSASSGHAFTVVVY